MRNVPLASLVVIIVLTSGCLFPPVDVDAPDDPDDPDDPSPTNGPRPTNTPTPGFVRDRGDDTATGRIDQGASTPLSAPGAQRHGFELPGRVEELHLRFDWDDDAADLDLRLALLIGGETVWTHDADGGATGSPDAPVDLTFTSDQVPELGAADADMLLQLDVSAKAAVDTGYTLYGEWWFLRPV